MMKEKLQKLLKNKWLVGGVSSVLVIAIIVCAVLMIPKKSNSKPQGETSETTSGVTVKIPDNNTENNEPETSSQTEVSDVNVELNGNSSSDTNSTDKSKADKPAKPVTPAEPEKPNNENGNGGGGIQIGDGDSNQKYDCKTKNHHCQNADAHAWLLNMELEGCEICGSHSCPSFYATDEWGGATVDYTKCPKYSNKNDPAKYCQKCGREMWSKDNPTGCFSYLQDTQCECGEFVKGNTCHHH